VARLSERNATLVTRDSPPDWICRTGRRPKPSTGSPRVLRGCPLSELSADSEADMGEAMGEGMTDGRDANKANAIAFYELMFNRNQPRAAIDRYAGAEYRQHNPGVGDGQEAFIEYFEQIGRASCRERG